MSLRHVEFPEKDEGLRDDVRELGAVVGKVIREQGGNKLFERVEQARSSAIRRREGDPDALESLCALVQGLAPDESEELVRAFSTYFQAVNLAEQVHRVRRGLSYLRDETRPQRGSLHHTVLHLREAGLSSAQALETIRRVRAEPVFTAHPTEATRRSILEKQGRIAERLLECLDPSLPPPTRRTAWERIRSELTASWQTEEHPTARPSVSDEREHVLYYVRTTLYRVLPVLYEALEAAFDRVYDDAVDARHLAPLIRIGSWVGGDMDGNPNVDGRTILTTLTRHRELVLRDYSSDLEHLGRLLSQSESRVGFSDEVRARLDEYRVRFPKWEDLIRPRHRGMLYRVLLVLMRERLDRSLFDQPEGYAGPAELINDLDVIERSLEQNQGARAGSFNVRRVRRRAEAFGFHLAALDVRQDGREHRDLLARMFRDPGWADRPSDERTALLHQRIAGLAASDGPTRSSVDLEAEGASSALQVFQAIGESRGRFGSDCVGPFIVSMAEDVDDMLSVLYLARLAGLVGSSGRVPLDVAPLFETVPDLVRAPAALGRMFEDPIYGPHLDARGRRQMVMVGYSDSNKDGGLASARWALQKAQAEMAAATASHGVALTIFHGRGGTTSRGGGKVHRAVEAAPGGTVQGRLRLTEQGEVIDAKYGLPSIALRSLERMVGALALRDAERGGPSDVPEDHARVMQHIADESRVRYRAMVYEDPSFYPYFRTGTPIDVIERMAIGSRPSARRGQRGVGDLRAIPWVFSWTQCRAVLPGWYGVGSGLQAGVDLVGHEALAGVIRSWPFLSTLIDDVEMVLAKSDLDIAARYAELVPEEHRHVFDRIRSEYDRTVALVTSLTGATDLLDEDPTLQRSIRLRNPYVDPMSLIQVDLLARWREGHREDDALFRALLSTVNGIARGLRNTG